MQTTPIEPAIGPTGVPGRVTLARWLLSCTDERRGVARGAEKDRKNSRDALAPMPIDGEDKRGASLEVELRRYCVRWAGVSIGVEARGPGDPFEAVMCGDICTGDAACGVRGSGATGRPSVRTRVLAGAGARCRAELGIGPPIESSCIIARKPGPLWLRSGHWNVALKSGLKGWGMWVGPTLRPSALLLPEELKLCIAKDSGKLWLVDGTRPSHHSATYAAH